jgi:hypothetical protein
MKEVTYEDWQKNSIPRMMWVWNEDKMHKVKRKVVYVLGNNYAHPVIALTDNEATESRYMHCAEIEKQRRMTNRELSRWLREKSTREFKYSHCDDNCIHSYLYYYESNADKEVDEGVVIRENDSDWREPLMEE